MRKILPVLALIFIIAGLMIFTTSCEEAECSHEWGEWVVVDEPTCTKGGYSTRTCSLCGETTRSVLYPSDHTYSDEWSFDGSYHWRAATCQHINQTTSYEPHIFNGQTCEVCGTVKATQGLQYRGDSESGTYIVIGLGTTLETEIVVARYYNGSDIVAVDPGAFSGSKGIKSIWLQEFIVSIGDLAFANSQSLTEVTLSNGLQYMGSRLFLGCPLLERIVFRGTVAEFEAIEKAGDWDGGQTGFTVICDDGVVEPPVHTYSEEWSFDGTHHWRAATCGHDELIVDYGAHNFIGSACESCGAVKASQGLAYKGDLATGTYIVTGLGTTLEKDIVVARYYNGYEITSVAPEAFANTPGLNSVWLQSYILKIGDRAFAGSEDLVQVTISEGTEYFGSKLFEGCTSLEVVIFRGTVAEFNAIEKADDWDAGASGYVIQCFNGQIQK